MIPYSFFFSHLPRLPDLLESDDVNLRIVAGEAIAMFYELAREDDEVSTICNSIFLQIIQVFNEVRRTLWHWHCNRVRKARQDDGSRADVLRSVDALVWRFGYNPSTGSTRIFSSSDYICHQPVINWWSLLLVVVALFFFLLTTIA